MCRFEDVHIFGHPRKLLAAFWGGGVRGFFVISVYYYRGTTPWFFLGPGLVMHAGNPVSFPHCGHRPFARALHSE
jgi:hypothetical protein